MNSSSATCQIPIILLPICSIGFLLVILKCCLQDLLSNSSSSQNTFSSSFKKQKKDQEIDQPSSHLIKNDYMIEKQENRHSNIELSTSISNQKQHQI